MRTAITIQYPKSILIEYYDINYSKIYLRSREYPLVAKELPEQIYDKLKSK